MKWKNLKNKQCPQCNGDLTNAVRIDTSTGPGLKHKCGFVISDKKFSEIVADRLKKELMYPDAEVVKEDFL